MFAENPIPSAALFPLVVNSPIVHKTINGAFDPPAIDFGPDTAMNIQ